MQKDITAKIEKQKSDIADTKGKLEKAKTEMRQLENHMTRLMNQNKTAERKARTRRLIERGAIVESLINGAVGMSNEQLKYLLERAITALNYNDGLDYGNSLR
jgi:Skp family chaperone for outer membrane proteins